MSILVVKTKILSESLVKENRCDGRTIFTAYLDHPRGGYVKIDCPTEGLTDGRLSVEEEP